MLRQLQTIAGLLARLLHKLSDAHAIRKKISSIYSLDGE